MRAKEFKCKILETSLLTPTVMKIRFEPNKNFDFLPGQFLSIYAPHHDGKSKDGRRAYSFANSPEMAKKNGYELCIKLKEDGWGTRYLASLRSGDIFRATAPYGDFIYEPQDDPDPVCFIATSTGIAPFRSMVQSKAFQNHPPEKTLLLFGAREGEILYQGEFEKLGVEVIYCITRADQSSPWTFQGRVTDYLKSLPNSWNWHQTQFYLCGNSEMIQEATQIIQGGHGVKSSSIHKESFSAPRALAPVREIKKKAA